jgi:hypothetical protein
MHPETDDLPEHLEIRFTGCVGKKFQIIVMTDCDELAIKSYFECPVKATKALIVNFSAKIPLERCDWMFPSTNHIDIVHVYFPTTQRDSFDQKACMMQSMDATTDVFLSFLDSKQEEVATAIKPVLKEVMPLSWTEEDEVYVKLCELLRNKPVEEVLASAEIFEPSEQLISTVRQYLPRLVKLFCWPGKQFQTEFVLPMMCKIVSNSNDAQGLYLYFIHLKRSLMSAKK